MLQIDLFLPPLRKGLHFQNGTCYLSSDAEQQVPAPQTSTLFPVKQKYPYFCTPENQFKN